MTSVILPKLSIVVSPNTVNLGREIIISREFPVLRNNDRVVVTTGNIDHWGVFKGVYQGRGWKIWLSAMT